MPFHNYAIFHWSQLINRPLLGAKAVEKCTFAARWLFRILSPRKKGRMDIGMQLAGAAIVRFGELEVFEP